MVKMILDPRSRFRFLNHGKVNNVYGIQDKGHSRLPAQPTFTEREAKTGKQSSKRDNSPNIILLLDANVSAFENIN